MASCQMPYTFLLSGMLLADTKSSNLSRYTENDSFSGQNSLIAECRHGSLSHPRRQCYIVHYKSDGGRSVSIKSQHGMAVTTHTLSMRTQLQLQHICIFMITTYKRIHYIGHVITNHISLLLNFFF